MTERTIDVNLFNCIGFIVQKHATSSPVYLLIHIHGKIQSHDAEKNASAGTSTYKIEYLFGSIQYFIECRRLLKLR